MQLCSEAKEFLLELAVRKRLKDGVLNRGRRRVVAVVALGPCADIFLEAELCFSMFFFSLS